MALCKNSEFVHNSDRYHIQTESWEPKEKVLVSQVFRLGKIVYTKKHYKQGEGSFTLKDVDEAHQEVFDNVREMLI